MPLPDEDKHLTPISFGEGSFVTIPPSQADGGGFHGTQMTIMPVASIASGNLRVLGTCFAITNDGLCMTARHVIDEILSIRPILEGATEWHPDISISAIYASNEPNPDKPGTTIGGPLPVDKIFMSESLDICLIKLQLPVNTITGQILRMPSLAIDPSIPMIGEPIFAKGYNSIEITAGRQDLHFIVSQSYSATRGIIEDIHFPQRDASSLHFPCFQTNARFDGGMSGGPVIDHSGHVRGVICSSFPAQDEQNLPTSYASMIGPALAIPLEVVRPDGWQGQTFLWVLVEGNAIATKTSDVKGHRLGNSLVLDFGAGRTVDCILPT